MNEKFDEFKKNIRGKRVAVLGIGISNQPLIRYILNMGAKVTACDRKSRKEIGGVCDEFESMGVKLRLGPNYLCSLDNYDVIFRSPSLRPDNPSLISAMEKGAYVTSEIEEFIKYCPGMVIGVTGSDGKTTTSTLIYNILCAQGYKVWLGGNIGTPLFDKLDDISDKDKVVLELSSFQLMDMHTSPHIAVITNLSPNHLDIHKSMEEYVDSKKNIYRYQNCGDLLILNHDNDITRGMECDSKANTRFFSRINELPKGAYLKDDRLMVVKDGESSEVCRMSEVKLPGLHNIENLLASFAAVSELCSVESMRKVAVSFTGVEHRIEFVREIHGIKFYNDSIASSPTRAAAGLNSFNQKVILIAGGYDKKIPFAELAETGVRKVKLLILIGATAAKIEKAFNVEMKKQLVSIPIVHASSLEDAVNMANKMGEDGDIVTLSPACASFDMFKNFEERGNEFKEIVNKLV